MTISVQQERIEVDAITRQMRSYLVRVRGLKLALNPKRRVYSTETHKLSQELIVGAVSLLVLALGLSCGSSYDFNLYNLLTAYLKDEEARKEMNAEIERWLTRQRPTK